MNEDTFIQSAYMPDPPIGRTLIRTLKGSELDYKIYSMLSQRFKFRFSVRLHLYNRNHLTTDMRIEEIHKVNYLIEGVKFMNLNTHNFFYIDGTYPIYKNDCGKVDHEMHVIGNKELIDSECWAAYNKRDQMEGL